MPRRFYHIQSLRALAALIIVIYHTKGLVFYGAEPTWFQTIFGDLGHIGADIFFIISGFAMMLMSNNSSLNPKTFLQKRILRTLPLYWIITGICLSVYTFSPTSFPQILSDWWYILASFLFIPATNAYGIDNPIVIYGWTLNFEMFFYLTFSLFVKASNFIKVIFHTLLMASVAYFGSRFFAGHSSLDVAISYFSDSIVFEFSVGLLLGFIYLQRSNSQRDLLILGFAFITAFFTLGTQDTYHFRLVYFGFPAASIVIFFLLLDLKGVRHSKLLCALGDATYSIYLVQALVIPALWGALKKVDLITYLNSTFIALITLVATILTGYFCYLFIEKPLKNHLNKSPKERPLWALFCSR